MSLLEEANDLDVGAQGRCFLHGRTLRGVVTDLAITSISMSIEYKTSMFTIGDN